MNETRDSKDNDDSKNTKWRCVYQFLQRNIWVAMWNSPHVLPMSLWVSTRISDSYSPKTCSGIIKNIDNVLCVCVCLCTLQKTDDLYTCLVWKTARVTLQMYLFEV